MLSKDQTTFEDGSNQTSIHNNESDEVQLNNRDPLLNTVEAASYLGIYPHTLDVWRCTRRYKISYVKVGRLVRYRKSALDEFLNRQTVR
ncbi:helix-turn-helix domain-containing protein [Novimethylophilus kurashikiensis]|uniref:helix-turn-helix domain-containing protein n=1 Tax=Novimethylophilus kurashikiensis TaxID=1825523 RepID=UPI000D59FFD8|nr:helix-turn-helix domain-containing protein [Novimethylophilus kurashikiensis]